MEKGVHRNVTMQEYRQLDAVSRSYLCKLRGVPAQAKVEYKHSGAMGLGTAAHTKLLEPHLYDEYVVEAETKTSNTKAFSKLAEDLPNNCIVTKGSMDLVEDMAEAVMKHPFAAELLTDIVPEPTIVWEDKPSELWCKVRPDIMQPQHKRFADLKFLSQGKADPRKFTWTLRDFGYDLQAASTILGTKMATGALYTEFWFVVVETDPPHRVSCYQLDEDWLGDAMHEWQELLVIEARCRLANDWPNYKEDNVQGETLYKF